MPMEPPPVDKHFKDFASAFRACQKHARCQGYALVKVRPCNYDNDGFPRRYDFACAYGGTRAHSSTSTGLRKSATRKLGCPFKMKVVQKKLFNNAWVADVVCADHNHGPEDPAKFPEHRVGSLRRRHFEKIKELSQDGKMTARGIRDALRADDPHLLVNEIDVANLLRELRVLEKETENGDMSVTTSRRRTRHFLALAQDEEEEESSPEPMPEPVPEVSAEESELHRTLLALVPKIVQETIASLPMAPPQHVAAVAAAATARLRDVAIPQLHAQQQLQQQQQQQQQPQQQQQYQQQEYQQQQYQQQPQQPQQQQHQQPPQQQQHLQQMQMQQQQMPQSPFQQPPQQQQPQPSPQPQPQPQPQQQQQPQQPQVPAYYRSVEQAPGTEAPAAGFGILVPNQGMQRQST